jgi:RHS repeat-associated protein
VLQENHYYPFGMRMSQLSSSANSTNKYLFGGKLLDNDFGLNWYDFGGRGNYDPALGRFHSLDRFAEKYYNLSSYQYCANNPMLYVDINGDSIKVTQDAIETILYGLKNGERLNIQVNNGMIDPESIKDQTEQSDDLFLKDLYEIASNEKTVEMSVAPSHKYKNRNGEIKDSNKDFDLTKVDELPPPFRDIQDVYENGNWEVVGNTGRALTPGNNSPTGAYSTDNNLQVIINSRGNMRQRAVGAAHEFGHIVLYLRSGGKIYRHGQEGVNNEINKRIEKMINKIYPK